MILPLLLALQTTPVQALPPANLPPPDFETAAVLAPVQRFFAAIAVRDAQAILREARSDGKLTGVVEGPNDARTVRSISWSDFAQRVTTGAERVEERSGTPAVEIDGDIAMVWAPYTFYADGKPRHCGVNHFDLIREGGRWKLLNITWTQRTAGCDAQ